MSVIYPTPLKNTRLTDVRDAVDVGGAAGTLEIGTAGMAAVLATITLDFSPCATVSGGVLTFSGFAKSAMASGSGTAAAARIRTSAAADVVTGLTVGTSGTDIILDSTNITSGQQVTINSATITHS